MDAAVILRKCSVSVSFCGCTSPLPKATERKRDLSGFMIPGGSEAIMVERAANGRQGPRN